MEPRSLGLAARKVLLPGTWRQRIILARAILTCVSLAGADFPYRQSGAAVDADPLRRGA
jgi:hypothetical protein